MNFRPKMKTTKTEQKYRDHNNYNAEQEFRNYNKTDIRQNHLIEISEIQAGSDNKPESPKFINFLLLIGKFSYFK